MSDPASGWRLQGTFWALDLEAGPPSSVDPLLPATFARVTEGEVPRLAEAMNPDPASVLAGRLAEGKRCYAAWVEGALAAFCWVSFGEEQIGEAALRIRLPPGEAYIWDCRTAPAYRRRRLYSALLAHIISDLRMEGLRRLWIGADTDNLPSQYGIAKAGFQRVADLLVAPDGQGVTLRGRPGAPQALIESVRRAVL